jgi:hypothetical protein
MYAKLILKIKWPDPNHLKHHPRFRGLGKMPTHQIHLYQSIAYGTKCMRICK